MRRAQLFRAAVELCAEKGFHETRADEIAARAGLSKGSLYYHFRSKDDLFLSMLEGMVDEFALVLEQALQDGSAAEALKRTIDIMLAQLEATPGVGLAMAEFYLLSLRRPEFRQHIKKHYDRLIGAGAAVIQRAIDSGECVAGVDPVLTARILFLGADGVGLMHMALDEPERGNEAVREFVSRVLDSIFHKEQP